MSTTTATPTLKPPRSLDQLGIVLSSACAVHCVLMPFVLGAIAYAGYGWLASEATEVALVLSAALVAIASLVPSYRKHRNPGALALFGAGIALIFASRAILPGHGWELAIAMGIGGTMIALAHYRNHRLCACCRATRLAR